MGDRFTFGVADRGGDVLYLYTHWEGSDWDTLMRNAISIASGGGFVAERANRIFISHIMKDNWKSLSGYAFSINRVIDSDYGFVPIVDFVNETISFYEYDFSSLGERALTLSLADFLIVRNIEAMLSYAMGDTDVTV